MKAQYYENDTYAYSEVFWGKDKNREYEHAADSMALRDTISGKTGWIVDIGGGFGRLVSTLKEPSRNVVILDASLDLLREAKARYGSDPAIRYIRANAYHLPYRDASIESAICMRMMHHIDDPDLFFKEANRVIRGTLYLEFPNKRHLLQQIRFYFLRDRRMDLLSARPELRDGMFLNFTLAFMQNRILRMTTFTIERVSGLSFLRQEKLKQLPTSVLKAVEHALQHSTFLAEWAPSILLTLSKNSGRPTNAMTQTLEDMLVCPTCYADLSYASAGSGPAATCKNGHRYVSVDGIWDFFIE